LGLAFGHPAGQLSLRRLRRLSSAKRTKNGLISSGKLFLNEQPSFSIAKLKKTMNEFNIF